MQSGARIRQFLLSPGAQLLRRDLERVCRFLVPFPAGLGGGQWPLDHLFPPHRQHLAPVSRPRGRLLESVRNRHLTVDDDRRRREDAWPHLVLLFLYFGWLVNLFILRRPSVTDPDDGFVWLRDSTRISRLEPFGFPQLPLGGLLLVECFHLTLHHFARQVSFLPAGGARGYAK